MYNPNVPYAGADGATRSVTNELTVRFGTPARPYEFVTGWKQPDNVSGHNPDSNGITHGVDLFLTPEQNRWAADHLAARARAGDKRVAYVIYAGQIASPSTGYHFAGSGWEHWDHPHLSVWDGYWGGPCALPAGIYTDTSSWGIATASTTPQSLTIIPIASEEEELMTAKDDIMERLDQIVAWQDNRFNEIVGWQAAWFTALSAEAERNRNLLAGFVRDTVASGQALTTEQIDAKLKELEEATSEVQLVKGDKAPEVFAWDGATGYRHIDLPEFQALASAGARLKTVPQEKLDAAVGALEVTK